jgi:superfamily II DNA or RNA helicase
MLFSLANIKAQIAPAQFNKGWQIFTEGKVTAPNVQRGGELITAVIPQARQRPLRVYIRTVKNKSKITINGECSCATKKNCAHVAAVLLQALEDQQALVLDENDASSPTTSPTSGKTRAQKPKFPNLQQTLLYILHLDDSGLLVETSVARRLNGGGYSNISYYEPSLVTGRTPPRFLEPVDLELLNLLDQLPRASGTGVPRLHGPQSAATFEAILGTGRCYFDNAEDGDPLSLGEPRQLEVLWIMDDFGYQRAGSRITPKADAILPLSSPWYLDLTKGQCAPVETGLQPDLIYALLNLAPVPPEQAKKVYESFVKAYPNSPVPPLQQLDIKTQPKVKSVPCLRLKTVEEPTWGNISDFFDFATLNFDYGGIEINQHSPTTRVVNGEIIRVQRDNKTEKAAVKRLRKLRFTKDEYWSRHTNEDCFFPDVDFEGDEPGAWLDFQVEHVPALRARGWRIIYDNFRYQLVEATNWICDVKKLEQQDWFSIGLGVEVDGQHIDLLPILLEFLSHFPRGLPDKEDITTEHFILPFENGQNEECLLRLPIARVLPLLETLLEVYRSTSTVSDKEPLRFNRIQLARLTALDQTDDGPGLQWLADDDIKLLAQRLSHLDGIPEVAPPAGLAATLRPYQQQGLNWLQFLREFKLAGILADDMGLGKTVQALAHLLLEKEAGRADRPSLVVAPTSLMFNWRHEAERFAPQLKVLVLHGPQRKDHFKAIADYDLVLTTYPLLTRDQTRLLAHEYHLLILDEAQVIKNPKAQASRVVRDINARHRLCLTGTPLENHLGELWSLFDFLLPGLLGNSKQFSRFFRSPIEKDASETTAQRLSRRIRPFLLRRTKQQVAAELPEKTEIIQTVALEDKQRELYETMRLAMHRRVREEIERQGLARSQIVVLDALLKLRQVCCDPRLVKLDKAHKVRQSAKLEMLMELLPEMVEEGRRILLFSQFTTMLKLIEEELKNTGIRYAKLTGQTRDRETPVRQFQAGEIPLFLISLKAGGVGLNLTAADTVIHYDPWWNPAVERQATDRAHRIGQKQTVFVYKLICEGTLEEKIQAMQLRKQALADSLYQTGGSNEPQWNEQDLDELFGPLV